MRAITWIKERGAEFAEVSLGDTYLRAAGVAVGADPVPYRLDYELDCVDGFVTRRLLVRTQGATWSRRLLLSRDPRGLWGIETSAEGEVDLPAPGGDPAEFAAALDCDLGECPVTNTMPVLRHGLMHGGAPRDLAMAWVSVPDLSVHPSAQRYTFVGPAAMAAGQEAGTSVIRFQSGTFSADVVFDDDGLVVDYPGLGRRA
ncbi:MAG TPA: putative glycolipid-binding domain-containing protein [Streptosporangiaceae bacterium]|nr:putative glycolipid-binding domain-containing protein [Streptosporangiaceae bacterium]